MAHQTMLVQQLRQTMHAAECGLQCGRALRLSPSAAVLRRGRTHPLASGTIMHPCINEEKPSKPAFFSSRLLVWSWLPWHFG